MLFCSVFSLIQDIIFYSHTFFFVFRHMPDNQLSSLLSSLKLSAPDVTEIAALAKSSNYQIACQRHFDVTHPGHLNNPELKV